MNFVGEDNLLDFLSNSNEEYGQHASLLWPQNYTTHRRLANADQDVLASYGLLLAHVNDVQAEFNMGVCDVSS